jgi:hypothetical protein
MSNLIKIYEHVLKIDCEKVKKSKQAVKAIPETSVVLSKPIKNLLEFLSSRQFESKIKEQIT